MWARAREIRAGLVLTVAVPQTVVTGAKAEQGFTRVGKRAPDSEQRQEPSQPRRPAAPIVLSETYAPAGAATADGKSADLDLSKLELGKSTSTPHQKKRGAARRKATEAVEAFEYSESSADVIGETAAPSTVPRKRSKKSAAFDPYANIDTSAVSGKVSRSRVSTKAGNRSMTYKK
ncbi:hypothetical protein H4R19_004889 [Coemansia spiralis]|nr:hypothetical protein H4R19_004889 [Coemansia spiralis]